MSDGTKFIASAGDVMYIPKGINYKVDFFTDDEAGDFCNACLINFMLTDENASPAAFSETITHLCKDKTGEITELFFKINEYYIKKRIHDAKSVFFKIISLIEYAETMRDGGAVLPALKHIKNNLNTAVSIEELSSLCAMSESNFRRNFKKETGLSPVKYINTLKVSMAKDLLKSEEITMNEITEYLGFFDKAYFCKVFKKIAGITPAEYRKKSE